MMELVGRLAAAYGPSGIEDEVRALIKEEIAPSVDEVSEDALGNLRATRHGKNGSKGIMVVAHMDEPSVVVTHKEDEGFLRFSVVGRVLPHLLLGCRVSFQNGLTGLVSAENPGDKKALDLKKMFIDTGMGKDALDAFKVGDMGVLAGEFRSMGHLWTGKSLDNRVGCAILIEAARALQADPGRGHQVDFVFATQSEMGVRGSRTSAYQVEPGLGLAVEVVEAKDTPKSERPGVALGKGVAVKVKDTTIMAHRGVRQLLEDTAEKEGLAYQRDVQEKGLSDAAGIQMSRAGVPAGALSVPCRYLFTSSECVDPRDVEACLSLLTAVLRGPMDLPV